MTTRVANEVRSNFGERDEAERMFHNVDRKATEATGISIFHVLTALSIIGSIALFLTGRKMEGIFVGLWPPTFQALKSVTEK
jgi:hypothetical protein